MGTNIEIKARVTDMAGLTARAARLSDGPAELITQEDIFFVTPRGRLKLRILAGDLGELIYYERTRGSGPQESCYSIAPTTDPEALRYSLAQAYGVRGVVRKQRRLYMAGSTRIHLDEVEGLGAFMELEVVLAEGDSRSQGEKEAADLMEKLGVKSADLVRGAYIDLLEK